MEMEERNLQIPTIATQAPVYLRATGLFLLRYGLAAMMLLFGLQKWTKAEAEAIQPWLSHSHRSLPAPGYRLLAFIGDRHEA
jgi:uncharacterized membrane protein YphA (DoxX/SURF4 family)